MRKSILSLSVALFLCAGSAAGQLNKNYFVWMGQDYLMDSRYREAIETLNTLLKFDPDVYEGYFLRGVAKYNLDDLLGAEQDFTTAIEKNPVFTGAYQYRAITRARLGNYDDALADFREAIDLRPDKPGAYYSRGMTYLLSQQFEKAIADFDMFIRFEGRAADAYVNRGTAYLYLKDTVNAVNNFEQAIRTNREYPEGYLRRGMVLLAQQKYSDALADFDKAVSCDSTYMVPYFYRGLTYNYLNRPLRALSDFDRVLELEPASSVTYFNRALLRTQIGDYNNALEDYGKVALYSPDNVLVYYNRAALYMKLGDFPGALRDYDRAIELYPDFANAYLGRSQVRYLLRDEAGADSDRQTAERKIAEYRSRIADSTFSVWADTSRQFNRLLSFDTKLMGGRLAASAERGEGPALLPLFRFVLTEPDTVRTYGPLDYRPAGVEKFREILDSPMFVLTNRESALPADSLVAWDRRFSAEAAAGRDSWPSLFRLAVSQAAVKQFTNSVNTYTAAIEQAPAEVFLYLNRSATQAEMIGFISSIDNSYRRLTIESDPAASLRPSAGRTYNYDEAIADLNKAAKLEPDLAYIYYNRGNLLALSDRLPDAFEDYSRAIELDPGFGEAYFNRGIVQLYMKDTRKGLLDISKAGELGVPEAYPLLKRYAVGSEDN